MPKHGADKWPEPDEGRLSRPVLRGQRRSNALLLPDIGDDAESGLVHHVHDLAANVADDWDVIARLADGPLTESIFAMPNGHHEPSMLACRHRRAC